MENQLAQKRALQYQAFCEGAIRDIKKIGEILLEIHKEKNPHYFTNLLIEYYFWMIERHVEELRSLFEPDKVAIDSEENIQKVFEKSPDILQIRRKYIADASREICINIYGEAADSDKQYNSLLELFVQVAEEKNIGREIKETLRLIKNHGDLCRDTIVQIQTAIEKYKEQALFSALLGILNSHENTFFHILTQIEPHLRHASEKRFSRFMEKHPSIKNSELNYQFKANSTIYEAIRQNNLPDGEKSTPPLHLLADLAKQENLEEYLLNEADKRNIDRTDLNRPEKPESPAHPRSLELRGMGAEGRPAAPPRRRTAPS